MHSIGYRIPAPAHGSSGKTRHGTGRAPLSAFVIAYNRERIIGTCLRALSFADEIIVIDKSSSDRTAAIARSLADHVITVPWSPTVEETRAFAAEHCSHDWILFLDDDECLSPQAVRFLDAELHAPRADIYSFPLRHYVLGIHDERAYYWPEHHIRCFRRGGVRFGSLVHGGVLPRLEQRIHEIDAETGACIHHLSHCDVTQWIEKTNRYTSQQNRARGPWTGESLAAFAHARIDHWMGQVTAAPDAYLEAVGLLRAIYDMVDSLKTWEEKVGLDGDALFGEMCARLDTSYAREVADLARPRATVRAA
jgi:glycosyltransferase involved in cell wall biosynthesis